MSRQVWKFGPVGFTWTRIEVPTNWLFCRFGIQGRNIFFWAEVDTEALAEVKEFIVIVMPTGVEVPIDGFYLDMVTDELSQTVWHLYWRKV